MTEHIHHVSVFILQNASDLHVTKLIDNCQLIIYICI